MLQLMSLHQLQLKRVSKSTSNSLFEVFLVLIFKSLVTMLGIIGFPTLTLRGIICLMCCLKWAFWGQSMIILTIYNCRMFYIFFESQNSKNDPVVIWLTGGPGCGSEMALFYENGPYQITKNLSLVWNDYSWNKVYRVFKMIIFVIWIQLKPSYN